MFSSSVRLNHGMSMYRSRTACTQQRVCDVQLRNQRFSARKNQIRQRYVLCCHSKEPKENNDAFRSTEGTQMETKFKEVAALDGLIDLLLSAKNKEELVKMVGENILSLNQDFWLRIASRSDVADKETKQKLEAFSQTVMSITEAMLKMTETRVDVSSKLLTEILTAAADENGHWDLPLAPDRLESLKQALRMNKDKLDESFLSTAFALIRKSVREQIDGMVPLMQKMLQLYAAQILQEDSLDPAILFLNELLAEESETWSSLIKTAAVQGVITNEQFNRYMESKLESTIGLPAGSYAQRIQAVEFLTKLKEEGESAFALPSRKSSASDTETTT